MGLERARKARASLPPVQENIDKIEKVVKEGNYYGAQQMYKSISARYILAERYSEALDILEAGSCIQLKNGQVTCGAELASMFVDTLVKGKYPCDNKTLDRVRTIFKLFPRVPLPRHLREGVEDEEVQQLHEALGAAKTRAEACSSFLKAAIRWSSEFGPEKFGYSQIHAMLAEYLYSESPELDMARVSFHFVRGNDPKAFAATLVNFLGKCYPGEGDLAIVRSVLMFLAMGNLRDGNRLMDEVKKQSADESIEFPKSDLIKFIIYLLQTLERDSLPLFTMLRSSFKPALDREPSLNETRSGYFSAIIKEDDYKLERLLDEIAEKFYGVQRRNPLQGMFGDIFKMM